MGTIAARDCRRILDLSETVAAIALLAACQALDLRGSETGSRRGRALLDAIRKEIPWVDRDRRQDLDIERVLALYRSGSLPVGTLRPPASADQVTGAGFGSITVAQGTPNVATRAAW